MINTLHNPGLIQALTAAIVEDGGVRDAVRACAAAGLSLDSVGAALVAAEGEIIARGGGRRPDQGAREIADRLSMALTQISEVTWTAADEVGKGWAVNSTASAVNATASGMASAEGGAVAVAGLPGEGHGVGRQLWQFLLTQAGYTVRDLGVRAPVILAREAAMADVDALALNLFDQRSRDAVHVLVVNLLRRGGRLPLLLGGLGVDSAFAQWLAIAESSGPYWGGIYYCVDGLEMLQVLKQVVLFEPPASAHDHEHTAPAEDMEGCASCGGCALAGACDLETEDQDG